ncbi:type II toxin-antitoxin system VapC family toxin [Saccharomonospora piscinae]|uniref:type II toxin-antitoxin system VapC family toxin n=1 Tax=Saccharomonospora piscinae TaxID=687388 RepID=UPI0004630C68|nr:PIN domain-containing protein [Saccharomonospora piscinae]TLW91522.1 PIN domain-containing protein [Saccharomonospora piscinae]
MIVVADTSALYAAFDADQEEHSEAASVMESETLAISPLVLTELDHLIRRDIGFLASCDVAEALVDRISDGQYKLAELKHTDMIVAQKVRRRYASLRLDLADAVGVLLADRYRTDRIFTLDHRDYRAVKPLSPQFDAFRLLPADGR